MSAVVSGLIGGAVAVGIVWLAKRTEKPAKLREDGWRSIRPGWLVHATFVGCLIFVGAILYFFATGGSARADAESQNLAAILLGSAFGLGAVIVAVSAYGGSVIWNDHELRVKPLFGRQREGRFSQIVYVRYSQWRGAYRIAFRDGEAVWVSEYMHGTDELLSMIPEQVLFHG